MAESEDGEGLVLPSYSLLKGTPQSGMVCGYGAGWEHLGTGALPCVHAVFNRGLWLPSVFFSWIASEKQTHFSKATVATP